MNKEIINIKITGDFVITKPTYSIDKSNKVIDLLSNSDLNIVNLECPATKTDDDHRIIKTGPYLKGDPNAIINTLKAFNINLVTLANNHILDFGEKGLKDTLHLCKKNNIETVGAGENLEAAQKAFNITIKGYAISIINFAENEWACATTETAGANPMDVIDNARQIKEAKTKADFVFVIVHGGHEYYNFPSPRMQKQYRFYAEQGADIVIGHHTHCINGYEQHNGIPIYYSLGNFLFTKTSIYEDWYTGLILEVEISGGKLNSRLYPVKQERETFQLELLTGEDKDDILRRISSVNSIILDETKLKQQWNVYVESKYNTYLKYWSPLSFIRNRYFKAMFSRLGINMNNKKGMALFLNLMRCESHVDMSKEVTQKYLLK